MRISARDTLSGKVKTIRMRAARKRLTAMKFLFVPILIALSGFQAYTAEVMVFAAASLAESLRRIASEYTNNSPDRILFNFAASGPLARQIEEGAPADIFFAADETKADGLEKAGLLRSETRVSRLGNALVIVMPPESKSIQTASDLAGAAIAQVAVGDVKTVPAGAYAKAFLEKRGLWTSVEPKCVPCESVRSVLAAVESGNVDAGIVYKTDAAISKKITVAMEVPAEEGPKITYPMALLKNAPEPEAAKRFLDFLNSDAAAQVFRKAGFIVLDAGTAK